jgi:hypothetical protein
LQIKQQKSKNLNTLSRVVIGNDIFVIGGNDGAQQLNVVQVLHTDWTGSRNFTWSSVAPMIHARIQPHAAVTSDRRYIYVFGGYDFNGNPVQSYEKYDVVANSWTEVGNAPAAMMQVSCYFATLLLMPPATHELHA